MSSEARFILAISLMLVVLVGTNLIFSPPEPPMSETVPGGEVAPDPTGTPSEPPDANSARRSDIVTGGAEVVSNAVSDDEVSNVGPLEASADPMDAAERIVSVETPLYRFDFSTHGARLVGAEISGHRSLRTGGPLEMLRESSPGVFGQRLVIEGDTVDLSSIPFEVSPEAGLVLSDGGTSSDLTFSFTNPATGFRFEVVYTFYPDRYLVEADGSVNGIERGLLLTGMGTPLAFTEADSVPEARMMAWVKNHLQEGIRSRQVTKTNQSSVEAGPFYWAAFKSKFFVLSLFPGGDRDDDVFGAVFVDVEPGADPSLAVSQNLDGQGGFDYAAYIGPQEYDRLQAIDHDFSEVNPYGWRWLRPMLRPIVGVIMTVLSYFHNTLQLGYGWVLILFGVLMRVVLWPLNQKAMRSQLRNMAVQPLLKEIQAKYKDQPEKLQKEMMKLYKEHGFNPLGGCLPMLIPWPLLIALFFVFQNSIELRGVQFLWLADLSAKDPLYILPVLLAISMFGIQYISYRSMDQDNPQMKMMMYMMPPMMGFIFMQFASGLNLYYAAFNVATLPQQFWIAKERKKVQAAGPLKLSEE